MKNLDYLKKLEKKLQKIQEKYADEEVYKKTEFKGYEVSNFRKCQDIRKKARKKMSKRSKLCNLFLP